MGIVVDKKTIKIVEKRAKAQFIATWIPTIIKDVDDRFHLNFQADLQIDTSRYMGANLGCIIWVHNRLGSEHRLNNKHEDIE